MAWRDGRNAGSLTALDDHGVPRWSRLLGRDFEDGVTWIVLPNDGRPLVTGARQAVRAPPKTDPAARPFDIWAATFDADGQVVWARSYALGPGGARVVAAGDRSGGFVIARESKVDEQTRTSRLPVIAIDAQGGVTWAQMVEFDGEAAVSAIVDAGPDRLLLFGTALPAGAAGGPFVLEIDRAGRIVDSAWIDLAAAASTPERQVVAGIDPVSVVRDEDGSFVLMGDIVEVSSALLAKAQARPGRVPPGLKSDLKGQIYLVRVDARGRAGGCSRPWVVRQQPLDVQAAVLDLPTVDMPAGAARAIPIDKLGVERLGPP